MFERLQNTILAMIAVGMPLDAVAACICEEAEKLAPFALCSILTVDDRGCLHPLAAPSLPPAFSAALNGVGIGPKIGSCGAAAFLKEPVAVRDIARSPSWVGYRHLTAPLGLKACWSSPVLGPDGKVLATFAFYYRSNRGPSALERDIVDACIHLCSIALERENARLEIHRLAYFDALTDLRNRASFELALEAARARPFSLLLIDVDRLKQVNDTFGHLAGDDLIRDVARRIGANVQGATAYRIGGDEFAVIVDGDESAEAVVIATRILAAMAMPAVCRGHALAAGVTIGGVAACLDDDRVPSVCRLHADMALYHAKEHVRGGVVMYSADLGTAIEHRNRRVRDVSEALSEGRIETHYQPVVLLSTGEVVGLEALCRLRTRAGGIVVAGEFQEAMQDVLIGARITDCMIARVAADIRSWLDMGIPFQHVGLNVSAADFQRSDLQERLVSAFGRQNVPLKHLILEVTESIYMGESDNVVGRAVKGLRARGLLVALDDFGTGYASLTHLLQFPVDIIKIDKSFVDHLGTGRCGTAIVKGLIDIADKLEMRIVAEGVENEKQAEELRRLGCTLAQGFLYGRAVGAPDMTGILLRSAQADARNIPRPVFALG
ncbi:EAL domain-containing protein [Beijerinckia sp. L45]|uniref:bifunctional diguanylate cyclase/phosphodiesterase n=1 Tax=Beijerinckia sp. L45 TaxID=1641855 RepID=UPI00131D2EE1|nr:EAL domain-containing protein [Beijerinckia sp. L45]